MATKSKLSNKNLLIFSLAVIVLILISPYIRTAYEKTIIGPQVFQALDADKDARVDSTSAGSAVKVAPGELLPISIKLSNFGGGERVDVPVRYSIFTSAGEEMYASDETIAVETTANLVKTIQIPFDTMPGIYTAKTSIIYGGQLVPATTEFNFKVERKILGLFQSDFFLYGGITLLISILMLVLGYTLIKHRREARFAPLDYSE